mgnify:CR=1 FL=1
MTIHDSILDTIGNTPVVRLHRVAPAHVSLYVKAESFNPGGSVKDRLAIAIVLFAVGLSLVLGVGEVFTPGARMAEEGVEAA